MKDRTSSVCGIMNLITIVTVVITAICYIILLLTIIFPTDQFNDVPVNDTTPAPPVANVYKITSSTTIPEQQDHVQEYGFYPEDNLHVIPVH